VRSGLACWRILLGFLFLAALALMGARLAPAYFKNREMQRFLDETVRQASAQQPPDMLRVAVVERASRLGLPVRMDQVRIRRFAGHLDVDLRYDVPVDFLLCSVDLHFHPRAGAR
jgi:hypothetical protein